MDATAKGTCHRDDTISTWQLKLSSIEKGEKSGFSIFFEIPYLSVIDDHTSGKPLLMQAYLVYARVVLDTWIYQVERNTITRISMGIQWQNWAYRWEPFSFYSIKCIIESVWYMNPKCSNLPKIIFIYCNYYIN